ncbi:MAG: DUF2752 domain-containing protein [Clostridia bacterium]|nr:DUF2752 domain-containing protein [Clostridia bacterium]
MIKLIQKNYKAVSIVFLFLAVFVILFPLITKLIQNIIPQFGLCPYLVMTGKPCPLCGGTRYIAGLPQAITTPSYLLHPFGAMMITIFLELVFRIVVLIKKYNNINLVKIDFIIHIIIGLLFIGYNVMFFITN